MPTFDSFPYAPKVQMTSLPHPNNLHLQAAEGWLELGNWSEANEELDRILPSLRAHPLVLALRYQIYAKAEKWDLAGCVAEGMSRMLPENPWGPFHFAQSLHKLKRTKEAYEVLIAVVDKFPTEWMMQFDLARYSSCLGKLEEAMRWLQKAIDVAGKKDIRMMALDW